MKVYGDIDIQSGKGLNLGNEDLTVYDEGTFTPTVTLVGGSGNVVPEYVYNSGRYTRIGNRVFIDILLRNDGGTEGAGTGQLYIALPVAVSVSWMNKTFLVGAGTIVAGSVILEGYLISGGVTVCVLYQATATSFESVTGDQQANTDRKLQLVFNYEV